MIDPDGEKIVIKDGDKSFMPIESVGTVLTSGADAPHAVACFDRRRGSEDGFFHQRDRRKRVSLFFMGHPLLKQQLLTHGAGTDIG